MKEIDISQSEEPWQNTVSHIEKTDKKKDIETILSDNTIILPKERYSSIDYIITFPEWARNKIFSSHIKFSSGAIQKMKADPFMKHEEKWENLLFFGDEVELSWVVYPPIEYEIQKNELSYLIYDDKKKFDKKELNIDADIFNIETEEEHN
jgi:hypothetical protein